jgi:GNAT superfamily N-acetyltransferase
VKRRLPALSVSLAEADAAALAALRIDVAEDLTARYGRGHWSSAVTDRGVLRLLSFARVLVSRRGTDIVGTLALTTRKPWAIDPAYFTKVVRAVYLIDMAVRPDLQRQGIGRQLFEKSRDMAKKWPGDAIRLKAYGGEVGAGGFYLKCGCRETGRTTYRKTPLVYYEMLL